MWETNFQRQIFCPLWGDNLHQGYRIDLLRPTPFVVIENESVLSFMGILMTHTGQTHMIPIYIMMPVPSFYATAFSFVWVYHMYQMSCTRPPVLDCKRQYRQPLQCLASSRLSGSNIITSSFNFIESGGNSVAHTWQWPCQQLSAGGDSNSFCNQQRWHQHQNSTVKGRSESWEKKGCKHGWGTYCGNWNISLHGSRGKMLSRLKESEFRFVASRTHFLFHNAGYSTWVKLHECRCIQLWYLPVAVNHSWD